jgi:hypothetical protein
LVGQIPLTRNRSRTERLHGLLDSEVGWWAN